MFFATHLRVCGVKSGKWGVLIGFDVGRLACLGRKRKIKAPIGSFCYDYTAKFFICQFFSHDLVVRDPKILGFSTSFFLHCILDASFQKTSFRVSAWFFGCIPWMRIWVCLFFFFSQSRDKNWLGCNI